MLQIQKPQQLTRNSKTPKKQQLMRGRQQ